MKKVTFEIRNRYGLTIVGDISFPENPIGVGVVLHGLGGFRQGDVLKVLENTLLGSNFITVNFDATNSKGESGGKYEDATLGKHYEDLIDVVSWVKSQDWYIPKLILTGHSMGAYAVAQYAEDYPQDILGIFPFAPVISGELSFEAQQKFEPEKLKNWKETGWFTRTSVSKPGVELTLPWSHMEERLNHNLLIKARNIKMPILIVVGENDTSCPPEHQQIFLDAIPDTTDKEFHIIKDAPHTFREENQLKQLEHIFDSWLKRL
jgi:pimeloyl-ACP methyl ester carboxylesterase